MLDKILTHAQGKRFISFANADGKRWIVPLENMRVALNLYQPSGIKGHTVKTLLPIVHSLSPVRKAIKAESLTCALQQELQDLLQEIFNTEDLEFALFCGTPSVHQKITIQLSKGGNILGYCKASDNKEILRLFERETSTLHTLAEKGVENIPQALFCGTLSNGVHIFVQSTVKSGQSRVLHEWGALQEKFLARLHEKTKQTILFEESDFHRTLLALEEHLDWLPTSCNRVVVEAAVARIMKKYRGKKVEFSAFHGDFTPWNMFAERGELFVFDFEYSALTYPAYLDRYHFELQTAIFEKRIPAEEIVAHMLQCGWVNKEKLAMYLLSMLSQYTLREKGKCSNHLEQTMTLWIEIIKNITTDI